MATTLFDLMIAAHRRSGTIIFDTSTAGSSAHLNSQRFSSATEDDQFNNGTIFIISASSNASGQFRRITDYDASSGQFTFDSVLSTTIDDGDRFGHSTPEFAHELMIELSNDALKAVGPLVFIDRSIVSSAAQQAYDLSTTVKYGDLLRVDILGNVASSADDPEWHEVTQWHVQPSTGGAANLLVLDEQVPSGRDIRVWYEGHHRYVSNSTDIIDGRIHPELATVALVERMYEYRNSRSRGSEQFDVQRWNDAKQQLAEARVRWPIWKPKRKPKLMIVGGQRQSDSPLPPPWGVN